MRRLYIASDREGFFPSKQALRILRARFSGRCMLPNLREIQWFDDYTEKHIARTLPLLMSPSLTYFNVCLENTRYARAVISSLASACNSLRFIYITRRGSDLVQESPDPVREFSNLLFKCGSQLLEFDVYSALSWSSLLHASQLPHLQYLHVRPDGKEQFSSASLPTIMFPSIQGLSIKSIDTDPTWLRFLAHIHSETLEDLVLQFRNAAAARAGLPMALRYIQSRGLHRTLTGLTISLRHNSLKVDGRTIEHLLFLKQLTTLEIFSLCSPDECSYELSDEDIEKLVMAMPKLKNLDLGGNPCSTPANNSVKSLIAIAKHCKRLEIMTIHINAGAVARIQNYSNNDPRKDPILGDPALVGCPLQSIIFGPCKTIKDEGQATIFGLTLSQLFPRLTNLDLVGTDLAMASLIFKECGLSLSVDQ